jgi:riboflavin kinase/FMN adenylyltransferase
VNLIRDLDRLPDGFRGGAISIGNFDGVHVGHARIIERLVAMARRIGGPAVVFTFDPHPARILRPEAAPVPLCWAERNAELLGALGVAAVVAYPTNRAFLQIEAQQFFEQIVRGQLAAHGMVEGPNFFFGHNRAGTIEVLRDYCARAAVELETVEPVLLGGQPISSSRIRALIVQGLVDEARELLSRPHRIRGLVVRGRGRGRQIGFPTANLEQIDTLLPGEGIYAGLGWVGKAQYAAAISIGSNPTFGEGGLKVEVFLLDFAGDLYDQTIQVDFLSRLRNIKRFGSAEELVVQMLRDVEQTRSLVLGFGS